MGVTASLAIIAGALMLYRLGVGKHIGHRVPVGFVLLTALVIVLVYRLWRVDGESGGSKRSVRRVAVTEMLNGDTTKSA